MGARVGPHVNRYHAGAKAPLAAHIEAARREAETDAGVAIGAAAVFVAGPRERRLTLRPGEAKELREYVGRSGLRVVAHSVYCGNPWTDPTAAEFVQREAEACQAAGICGLVVHLPKRPASAVLARLPRLLSRDAPDVVLYLETPSVTPRETYYETPAKLGALFQQARALDPGRRVGLCADTAHLWTSGIDLRTRAAAEGWFRGLETHAPAIPHVMIHCNDSARELGRGPDMHAALGQGKIWGEYAGRLGASGLGAVLDYANRHETTMILERAPKEALRADYLALRPLLPRAEPAERREEAAGRAGRA
ncbi:MAG TPA: TIM barrel protein, partial [Elusimicrobiota bacterium]|nr:TIM barrel protein [Elusimicrobiota bacterium]